jgi:hypothetical protein
MDRLTIKEINSLNGSIITDRMAQRVIVTLLDTMRENERYKVALESILVYEAYGCGCNSVAKEALSR